MKVLSNEILDGTLKLHSVLVPSPFENRLARLAWYFSLTLSLAKRFREHLTEDA